MRIAFAQFAQESDTFTPLKTTLAHFERDGLYYGEDVLRYQGLAKDELAGIIRASQENGIEMVPIMRARARPFGNLTASTYDYLKARLLEGLRTALPVDGVCLALHGAMVVDGLDDPEGDILSSVRALVGPSIPITASFDLHANITNLIVSSANAITIYHTHPHVDAMQTGYQAASILIRTLRGEVRPVMAMRKLPMITPAEKHTTTEYPMKVIMGRVLEIEREQGILAASLAAVQPWLDIQEMGWTAVVVADGDPELARKRADEIAELAWSMRREFLVTKTPVLEALERARQVDGLVVLVDSNDGTNSGGTGDTTAILRALLEAGFPYLAMLPMTDPESVAKAIQAGVRAEVDLEIGGKMHETSGGPVRARARVRAIAEGIFAQRAPQGLGVPVDVGRMVAVSIGNIYVVLTEHVAPGHDPQVYRCVGLEPAEARVVVVKSPVAFRASYEPLAKEIIYVDTPGLSPSDLRRLPFKRVPRPIFPLDDI